MIFEILLSNKWWSGKQTAKKKSNSKLKTPNGKTTWVMKNSIIFYYLLLLFLIHFRLCLYWAKNWKELMKTFIQETDDLPKWWKVLFSTPRFMEIFFSSSEVRESAEIVWDESMFGNRTF